VGGPRAERGDGPRDRGAQGKRPFTGGRGPSTEGSDRPERGGERPERRGPGAAPKGRASTYQARTERSTEGTGARSGPASKRAGKRPAGAIRRGEAPQERHLDHSAKPTRKPGSKGPWIKDRPQRDAGPRKPSAGGEWRENKKGRGTRSEPAIDGLMRLNRYLAQSGLCSRREADDLITAGVVSVNGKVVTELGTKVYPSDKVHYGGQRLSMEKKRYVLLNKPKDFITTTDDPRDRRTVMNLIATACTERLYPVGRLDRQTTGVLLMTNDGDLAKKLTHPSHGAEKIYHVTLDKSVTKAHLTQLVEGVELEDGPAQADEATYVQGATKREVGLKIHMGRNRIVRRMFEHLGYDVLKLDRVVFAGLTKKDVPRGEWRHLTEKEVMFLSKRK
jgi:23S rRNA pseudouridine2605 synthase